MRQFKLYFIISIITNFLLVLNIFVFAQEKEDITNWLSEIRNGGLALTDQQIVELFTSPNKYKIERKLIANKYGEILNIIIEKKNDLYECYRSTSPDSQMLILKISERYIIESIEKLLVPLWIGIDLDSVLK